MGATFFKTEPNELAFGIVPALRKYELYQARYHEMLPVLAPYFKAGAPRVLDIGSGHGDSKRFADTLGRGRWTGIEIHPARRESCLQLGYETVRDDIDLERQALPFDDQSFEVVIASHVLEHLENAESALKDWYRVLKPGGALILGVPMHLGPIAALAKLKYRVFGRRLRGHCHFFSMGSLRRFLAPYPVERIWGFRILSARRELPLEDWQWFYRASVWLGARVPGVTAEVNVHLTK